MHQETALRHDTFIAACARAGFTPTITMEATEPLAALGLVAAGLGVTTIRQILHHQAPAGVVLHELSWFSYRTAWRKVNLRSLVEVFRKTLLQASGVVPEIATAKVG